MEGNPCLVKLIQEMQSKINTLERENRALRVELSFSGQRSSDQKRTSGRDGREEEIRRLGMLGEQSDASSVAIGRSNSAESELAWKEQKGNTMTVRRYSISTSLHSFAAKKRCKSDKSHSNGGILEVQGIVKPPESSLVTKLVQEEEKGLPADCFSSNSSSKRIFQDHVFKCRGKVKAVSFLLPMDASSYSQNQGPFENPPNQNSDQLSTVIEKDI
ncbi:putative coiled-coil domain-containing protein 195 [Ornithorhynchus anatinus]|uniref:putative coiled-coil domain-containing protein 195 n=1 Tax=Ornithorhynchus anatinus TaxID=9258 RepID=UPI0010A75AF1|nr:putative coiled-coil domain-containing protein 195 [Ornithorhynchus anatinus]